MASKPPQPKRSAPHVKVDAQASFAEFHENYVRHYIALADTKAMVLLGVLTSLLAYFLANAKFQLVLFDPACSIEFIIAATSFAAMGCGALLAALVIVPRTGKSSEGLIYFRAVAAHKSSGAYRDVISSKSPSELADARLFHCYDVATICTRKYNMLVWAMRTGFAGVGLSVLQFAILYVPS